MTTYEQASDRFKTAWTAGQQAAQDASESIADMLKALEAQNYTRTAAVNKIVADHKSLKGFSQRTLYRNLPAEFKNMQKSLDVSAGMHAKIDNKTITNDLSSDRSFSTDNMSIASDKEAEILEAQYERITELSQRVEQQDKKLVEYQEAVESKNKQIEQLKGSYQNLINGRVILDAARFRTKIWMAANNQVKAFLTVENGNVVSIKLENEK